MNTYENMLIIIKDKIGYSEFEKIRCNLFYQNGSMYLIDRKGKRYEVIEGLRLTSGFKNIYKDFID